VALARAELARSRQERAKADVESALRLEPDDPGARALLREISGTAAVPPPR